MVNVDDGKPRQERVNLLAPASALAFVVRLCADADLYTRCLEADARKCPFQFIGFLLVLLVASLSE